MLARTLALSTAIIFVSIAVATTSFAGCVSDDSRRVGDRFPAYDPGANFESLVTDGRASYRAEHYDFNIYLNDHTWDGAYFRYNIARSYEGNPTHVIFDADGLPKVNYPPESDYAGGFEYNPTTLIQFALMTHAKFLAGDKTQLPAFLKAVDKVLSMQNESGGFEYPFPYKHFQNTNIYQPGWTSAIAQGQALSMLARAYAVTGNTEYVAAGNHALNFLLTLTKDGGSRDTLASLDPSLTDYVMFEEYPIIPPDTKANYTVNGFMHTLIGLYDWSFVKAASADADAARYYYRCGVATLKKIIPYADVGGFSAYDLGHVIYGRAPVVAASYHDTHIYMLFTFYQLTQDKFFLDWARKWAKDADATELHR